MRDKYKYRHLVSGKARMKGFSNDLSVIRSKRLRPAAKAFEANMQRLSRLAVTFAEIAYQVRRDTVCWAYAEYKTLGKVNPPRENLNAADHAKVFKEFVLQWKEFTNLTSDERSEDVGNWGVSFVETMLRDTHEITKAMEGLLSSVLISSWAAFETLASDLWIAAIDYGPTELQDRLLLASGKWLKPDDTLGAVAVEEIEHIPKGRFGSRLKAGRKVSFQKRSKPH